MTTLDSLKCDQCVKHLFVMLGIEFQPKEYKIDFIIERQYITGVYDELCVRPAVLENKWSLNNILIHKNIEFYTLVTLELT